MQFVIEVIEIMPFVIWPLGVGYLGRGSD